jgi:hypothetical protein
MTRKEDAGEPTENSEVNTARLEKLAKAAAGAAQAKQWQARQNGMQDLGEASEVRNLRDDARARAQAEASMQQIMAKPTGKRRTR